MHRTSSQCADWRGRSLGEGTQHYDVALAIGKAQPRLIVAAGHVFCIGGIEHEKHVVGQPAMETLDLANGKASASWIVGICDEEQARARGYGGKQRVNIRGEIVRRSSYHARTCNARREREQQIAVLGDHDLVIGAGVGVRDEAYQLLRPVAANDSVGIDSVLTPDGLPQAGGATLRIPLQRSGVRVVSGKCLRTRSCGAFVGGELYDAGQSRYRGLSELVRRNVEQPRTGNEYCMLDHGAIYTTDVIGQRASGRRGGNATPPRRREQTMSIRRIDPGLYLSRAVVCGSFVFLAGLTADDRSQGITGQTEQIQRKVDGYLGEAGSDKSRLLSAQIWLRVIGTWDAMNRAWSARIDKANPPAARRSRRSSLATTTSWR